MCRQVAQDDTIGSIVDSTAITDSAVLQDQMRDEFTRNEISRQMAHNDTMPSIVEDMVIPEGAVSRREKLVELHEMSRQVAHDDTVCSIVKRIDSLDRKHAGFIFCVILLLFFLIWLNFDLQVKNLFCLGYKYILCLCWSIVGLISVDLGMIFCSCYGGILGFLICCYILFCCWMFCDKLLWFVCVCYKRFQRLLWSCWMVVWWDVLWCCFLLVGKLFWVNRFSHWSMAEGGDRRHGAPHGWRNREQSDADSGNELPDACNPPVARSPPRPPNVVWPPRPRPDWNQHDEDAYLEECLDRGIEFIEFDDRWPGFAAQDLPLWRPQNINLKKQRKGDRKWREEADKQQGLREEARIIGTAAEEAGRRQHICRSPSDDDWDAELERNRF